MQNDHRVRLTKLILRESFIKLLEDKPITKITVKELCERSGINRATFYAHYEDVYALQNEVEEELLEDMLSFFNGVQSPEDIRPFIEKACDCLRAHPDACSVILGKNGDYEILLNMVDIIKKLFLSVWKKDATLDDAIIDLHFAFGAHGAVAVVRLWVQNGYAQSPAQIAKIILENTIRSPLRLEAEETN